MYFHSLFYPRSFRQRCICFFGGRDHGSGFVYLVEIVYFSLVANAGSSSIFFVLWYHFRGLEKAAKCAIFLPAAVVDTRFGHRMEQHFPRNHLPYILLLPQHHAPLQARQRFLLYSTAVRLSGKQVWAGRNSKVRWHLFKLDLKFPLQAKVSAREVMVLNWWLVQFFFGYISYR